MSRLRPVRNALTGLHSTRQGTFWGRAAGIRSRSRARLHLPANVQFLKMCPHESSPPTEETDSKAIRRLTECDESEVGSWAQETRIAAGPTPSCIKHRVAIFLLHVPSGGGEIVPLLPGRRQSTKCVPKALQRLLRGGFQFMRRQPSHLIL